MSTNRYRIPLDDIANRQLRNQSSERDLDADLKRILRRFTKAQLLTDVVDCDGLSRHICWRHQGRLDKNQTIDFIIETAKQASEDLDEVKALFELKYCQLHSNARLWTALEILNAETYVDRDTSPELFAKKLAKSLNKSQLFCKARSQFYDGALWTIIYMNRKSKSDKFFVLTFPRVPVVIFSNLKVAYQEVLFRTFVLLFKGASSEKLPLRCKSIETLLYFSCQQASVEPDSELHVKIKKKKRVRKVSEEEEVELTNVVLEDEAEEVENDVYLLDTFGSEEQLPIQSLTYTVNSDFYGFSDDHESIPVVCQAVLKGQNVLEGIQQLVRSGVAHQPLPSHIADVPKHCCNNFQIKIPRH